MSRTYSEQFKEEALKLSDEIGMKKAVQQLGIPYYKFQIIHIKLTFLGLTALKLYHTVFRKSRLLI